MLNRLISKADNTRLITFLYFFLLLYTVAILVWWGILLHEQNVRITHLELQNLELRESHGGGHNSSGDSWGSMSGGVSQSSSVGHGHSVGEGISNGHSFQSSAGLSAHVSDSLVNHLVSHGYSAHEAQQTVHGVSHTLGQEVNGHTMGNAGSVEFHKEGPVAVSLSNENTASSGHTLSVAMDTLKAVHESGMSQNLDAVQSHRSAPQAPQAVAELSR